eukprot:232405-Chlamydomonas_euryale.AAC.4
MSASASAAAKRSRAAAARGPAAGTGALAGPPAAPRESAWYIFVQGGGAWGFMRDMTQQGRDRNCEGSGGSGRCAKCMRQLRPVRALQACRGE